MGIRSLVAGLVLALTAQPCAAETFSESLKFFGDVRMGRFASEREARDGTETEADDWRMRLRLGAEGMFTPEWRVRLRLAWIYSTDQDGARFWREAYAPTATGLERGDAAVDELYLGYAPQDGRWSLRAGRFQSKFELPGIASKSFDRNDSPNVDVNWTDGLHWRYQINSAWQSHLILQRNVDEGTGPVARPPLSFTDSDSHVTLFTGLESNAAWGPVKYRMVSLTYMPDSLAPRGIDAASREDYITLTARASAEWPLGDEGLRVRFGAELGWAPNTPEKSVVGVGTDGRTDGNAAQFSMDALDFFEGHGIAFVYGRAGAGWLISPDFRNNDRLLEVRYQWKFAAKWSVEARVRQREELKVPPTAEQRRLDEDVYVRLNGRF